MNFSFSNFLAGKGPANTFSILKILLQFYEKKIINVDFYYILLIYTKQYITIFIISKVYWFLRNYVHVHAFVTCRSLHIANGSAFSLKIGGAHPVFRHSSLAFRLNSTFWILPYPSANLRLVLHLFINIFINQYYFVLIRNLQYNRRF